MQPSSSLRGTFEADDVNSMQLHTPHPRIAGHAGLQGYPFGKGTFLFRRVSQQFLGRTFGFALLLTESIGAKNRFA